MYCRNSVFIIWSLFPYLHLWPDLRNGSCTTTHPVFQLQGYTTQPTFHVCSRALKFGSNTSLSVHLHEGKFHCYSLLTHIQYCIITYSILHNHLFNTAYSGVCIGMSHFCKSSHFHTLMRASGHIGLLPKVDCSVSIDYWFDYHCIFGFPWVHTLIVL